MNKYDNEATITGIELDDKEIPLTASRMVFAKPFLHPFAEPNETTYTLDFNNISDSLGGLTGGDVRSFIMIRTPRDILINAIACGYTSGYHALETLGMYGAHRKLHDATVEKISQDIDSFKSARAYARKVVNARTDYNGLPDYAAKLYRDESTWTLKIGSPTHTTAKLEKLAEGMLGEKTWFETDMPEWKLKVPNAITERSEVAREIAKAYQILCEQSFAGDMLVLFAQEGLPIANNGTLVEMTPEQLLKADTSESEKIQIKAFEYMCLAESPFRLAFKTKRGLEKTLAEVRREIEERTK